MGDTGESKEVFEELLQLEERYYQKGVEEGQERAEELAFQDGYTMGRRIGMEIGEELGWYRGSLMAWEALLKSRPEGTSSSKLPNALENLRTMIDEFPSDPTDENILTKLERIRAKFKHLTALLKIKQNYRDSAPSQVQARRDLSF